MSMYSMLDPSADDYSMMTADRFSLNTSNPALSDTFLRRSFFIYDKTACKNEEDPPEDMVVFFYPPEIPLESQMFIIGSCSSMIEFAKEFTFASPKILTMEKSKMAILEVGVLTLVLTSSITHPDSALLTDLEHVYGAFRFFFGSFDMIIKNTDGERQQFLDIMKEYGKEVIPFVRRYESQSFPSFDPISYTYLAPTHNRFFLMTSEILNSVRSESDNLGGCILYQDSVLCSHLEPTTTLYIMTRLEAMYGNNKVMTDPKHHSPSEVMPVFLPTDELSRLRQGRAPILQASDDLRSQLPEGYFTPSDGGEFVGLYILFFQKFAMAVLMNLPAMYDERHITKTRSLVNSKLFSLDKSLTKSAKALQQERQTLSYNYLTFDKSTQLVITSASDQLYEPDLRFRSGVKTVHEMFTANDEVYCVMLKDHGGMLFGRRMFDREVYYQTKVNLATLPSATPNTKHFVVQKELAKLEETAREHLQELNINLI